MSITSYKALLYKGGSYLPVDDILSTEAILNIHINNMPFSITLRTPGNEIELIRGLLFSECIYTNREIDFTTEIVSEKDGLIETINIIAPDPLINRDFSDDRSLVSASSCGLCGKKELITELNHTCIDKKTFFSSGMIEKYFEKMNESQRDFSRSGGVHAAAAFDGSMNCMTVMEDIGRHNAVDKIIGHLLIQKQLENARAIIVSGRISFEICSKAFQAGFELLASVSAPSSYAVDYCNDHGITLLAFCRGDKHTVYTHPERMRA